LFAFSRSSMNLQLCTSYSTSRYVIKYALKIDENNYILLHVDIRDQKSLRMEKVFLHNTKISSSAVSEAKALNQRRYSGHPCGRAISMFEMIQLILGYPQVHTDSEFVPVSTLPLGERRGVERTKPIDSLKRETLERVTVQNLPFATGPSDLMSNVIPVDRICRLKKNHHGVFIQT
jgi:hypothetical protein